ncbi:MAG: hypothetical protein IT497_08540 [Ottowia sp.]|nr:hypothetical protein [Ottowia sp.]
MPISLSNFAGHSNFKMSSSRLDKMLSGDEKTSLYMGFWDKFKNLFRSERKQDVLKALYDLIH